MQAAYAEAALNSNSARIYFEDMKTFLDSGEAAAMRHEALEQRLTEDGRELMRRLLQEHLDQRSSSERRLVAVTGSEGADRVRSRPLSRNLGSVFGPVRVWRLGYQADGVAALFPLDAALNLPEEMHSFGVRRLIAEQAAKGSFDEVVTELEARTGSKVHKRQVEQLALRAARDFDTYYAQRSSDISTVNENALLVISVDGKGITMRHEDLRSATRMAAERNSHKLSKRLSRGEKRNRKRMAEVAAVYLIEPFERQAADVLKQLGPLREVEQKRPKPSNKRVWASVESSMQDVIGEAFEEAERLDPEHVRSWVVTVDGNTDQIRAVRTAAQERDVMVTLVLDVIHVIEYLWKAAYCFHPDGSKEAQGWVSQRLEALLTGHDASQVAAGMRRSATHQGLTSAARKAVDKCARYLINNRTLLDYAEALKQGFPIATGVIEGACRYLVKDRMDRTGARWSLEGAEAVLRLRALVTNGDFDAYWEFHLAQEHERNHRSRYANRTVPSSHQPPASERPKLRLVS